MSCLSGTSRTHNIKIGSMMSNFSNSPALTWIYQPPLHTMWILLFVAVFVSLLRTSYSCTSLDFHQNYAFIEDWKHSRLNHCQSCPISNNVRGTAGARPGDRQCLITLPKSRSLLPHLLQKKRQLKVQWEYIHDESHGSLIRQTSLFIAILYTERQTKTEGLWQVFCTYKE